MSAGRRDDLVDCLLLPVGENCWLAPATLVAEVIAHFHDRAPDLVDWQGHSLPCLDDTGGRVRALAVLRRLGASDGARFYALALREPPRALAVDGRMIAGDADAGFELQGLRAVVFDAQAVEARLPLG